ncbi:MAG: hypothetical protein KJ574_01945, partial [Nanoarchaeota archaeon]|nr:hypothetical protein [Nanoarchaeota archaeon]
RFSALLAILAVFLVISGCGTSNCVEKQVKYYERMPVTQTNEQVEPEEYTYQQPSVETICGSDFDYIVEYEDKFWLDEPLVLGEPNQIKRTVYIRNNEKQVGQFGFDILHLENGTIVKRTLNPAKTLVAAEGTRTLYLAWSTDYALGKDIKIDVIDVPRLSGDETCERIVRYTNVTGVRNNTITSESTSYENVIKMKTVKVCD